MVLTAVPPLNAAAMELTCRSSRKITAQTARSMIASINGGFPLFIVDTAVFIEVSR
jgi:hypothetical protein